MTASFNRRAEVTTMIVLHFVFVILAVQELFPVFVLVVIVRIVVAIVISILAWTCPASIATNQRSST